MNKFLSISFLQLGVKARLLLLLPLLLLLWLLIAWAITSLLPHQLLAFGWHWLLDFLRGGR